MLEVQIATRTRSTKRLQELLVLRRLVAACSRESGVQIVGVQRPEHELPDIVTGRTAETTPPLTDGWQLAPELAWEHSMEVCDIRVVEEATLAVQERN